MVHTILLGLTVKTNAKSVERGAPLTLRFYEDGNVRFFLLSETGDESSFPIERTSLVTKQLGGGQIAYLEMNLKSSGGTWETVFPIKTLELKIGQEYQMDFFVGDKERTTGLQSEVRKVFGYDAVAKVQKMMDNKEIMARVTFEDGTTAATKESQLVFKTGGAEKVVSIEFYHPELVLKYTFEEAEEFFRSLGVKREKLVTKLANNYQEVLGYSAEDIEKTGDKNLLGKFGELQIIERYAKKLRDIHYKVTVDGKEGYLDVVLEDAIVEVKYWADEYSYKKHFDELVEQLRTYKKAADQEGLEKIYLVFGKKGVFAEFDGYVQKLRNALGDDTSWLVICHGLDEFVKAYGD